ncbi:protein kinase [Dethiosulfatarculus sandiegensis]|uniref:Protein kinase domain-containing protein n=1 Tax=Dethiosulfatarculus sandiegensis TaxID=1429043 RepID=A0A0D2I053_9BACT|nr:protein kinase [Dethiosulfatarculus sandiegensis]KIX15918.1 hypothetical protein X474_01200 [Dethiosulfatarculus sandiegensis]
MDKLNPITDTTEIYSIDRDDILLIGGRYYKVTGHAHEMRFGMDDPKFWVKWAIDQETGEKKLIKLSFFENFETRIGPISIMCFRSPEKEAKILDQVRNHPHFMQGIWHKDEKDNIIRILDVISGPNFFNYIASFNLSYEDYFRRILPVILKQILKVLDALRFLHLNGFRHGDIRNDHIIVERDSGNYVWIDFDYDYQTTENPFGLDLFGIGNILIYAVGMGLHTLHMIKKDRKKYGNLYDDLDGADFSIIHQTRFINLKKIYPIIPKPLNDVLMHFSRGASIYYEVMEEIIEDVSRCIYLLEE